jgi:branched-chain amino acid aminotransferase
MINYNGQLYSSETILSNSNRGFLYGDAVFETVKIVNSKILFLEDHYFRLMSAMRIVRMEIPMNFTMEYFEEQILILVNTLNYSQSARARITVFREDGGNYLPETNTVSYLISASKLQSEHYSIVNNQYEVDLYKDYYVAKHLLSSIKTTNKIINITASIFAKENGLDNCLLINENKNIIEALQGNLFMLVDNKLITPPVSEGCLNGIMRKQIINIVKKMPNMVVAEEPISPFELQKASELFITNVIKGIQPITRYRKTEYKTDFANKLLKELNTLIQ